ncbi:hypothetical protein EV07_0630 [Prochlorococcus sp. MIT 0603]|nr:hypothetical protein EV07_0630 [Prochlorococcus sp. MIT 0603]
MDGGVGGSVSILWKTVKMLENLSVGIAEVKTNCREWCSS